MSWRFASPLCCVRFALLFLCPCPVERHRTTGRDGPRGSRSPLPGAVEPSLVLLAAGGWLSACVGTAGVVYFPLHGNHCTLFPGSESRGHSGALDHG